MDTESLKSLAWLLVWGGAFYIMMRYGCGAHMMGGHGHEKNDRHSPDAGDADGVKDPVCGMAVDPEKTRSASVHQGKTYYFCSLSCRDKFEKSPARYIPAQ